jgi:hypothetical protein
VFYGGDSSDDGLECTEDLLAEYWAHFLGPNGNDYHARKWTTATSPAPTANGAS